MKTLTLSDFEMQKLIDGYSTTSLLSQTGEMILITFQRGSKRYIDAEKKYGEK